MFTSLLVHSDKKESGMETVQTRESWNRVRILAWVRSISGVVFALMMAAALIAILVFDLGNSKADIRILAAYAIVGLTFGISGMMLMLRTSFIKPKLDKGENRGAILTEMASISAFICALAFGASPYFIKLPILRDGYMPGFLVALVLAACGAVLGFVIALALGWLVTPSEGLRNKSPF
jgi:hypothetical protein